MRYANELKVGIAILLAVAVFILGVRFLRDIPVFSGSHSYVTELVNAKGISSGSAVRINGVNVGAVDEVRYDQEENTIQVRFHINSDLILPEGTEAQVTGIEAFGGVRLDVFPGPMENPRLKPGDRIRAKAEEDDLFGDLSDQAPVIIRDLDRVLGGMDAMLTDTRTLVADPGSDLRQMLVAIRGSAADLSSVIEDERGRIRSILSNFESLSADLERMGADNSDSVAVAVTRMNTALESLNRSMGALETTTGRLDRVIAKIDEGQGTLGMLINDPGLYSRLDSVASGMNNLIADFQANPRRYLRQMKLVEIF